MSLKMLDLIILCTLETNHISVVIYKNNTVTEKGLNLLKTVHYLQRLCMKVPFSFFFSFSS